MIVNTYETIKGYYSYCLNCDYYKASNQNMMHCNKCFSGSSFNNNLYWIIN